MNLCSAANKYIENKAPWTLFKEGRIEELANVMTNLANSIFVAAMLLSPILINKSKDIFKSLGLDEKVNYELIKDEEYLREKNVVKLDALFPRLDENKEKEFIANIMNTPKEKAAA